MPRRCRLIVSFLIIIFIPGLASGQKARTSYGGTSGYNVPLWVTQDAGLFKEQGLAPELILISGDAASLQALLANDLDFTNAAGTTPIQGMLQGADFVLVGSSYNLMPYSFVVTPDIRTAGDLKGKRMAVSRLGGITEFAGRLALEKFGLAQNDMTLVQAGADGSRIAARRSR